MLYAGSLQQPTPYMVNDNVNPEPTSVLFMNSLFLYSFVCAWCVHVLSGAHTGAQVCALVFVHAQGRA